MGIDAAVTLISLFGPKLVDMAKGWIHRKDSPEATMAAMAQTNPAGLADYVKAQAEMVRVRIDQFNQDMPISAMGDQVPRWIVAIWWLLRIYRAAIRPAVITLAFFHTFYVIRVAGADGLALIPEWIRYQYEVAISSWFGDRWR